MATQQDKTTRDTIEEAIMVVSPKVSLDIQTTFDDVRRIIRDFMRKHPEIFWFSHQYLYDEKSGVLEFRYNFTKEKRDFFKKEIEKVIEDDFQVEYVKTLSELERLVYVYKWIANRTTYNEYSSFNQTIYSVLINRNSVCTGYAKTAQYLLGLIGIESQLVLGKFHSDKSEHGSHGWNIVKIDGKWYHVDFCLADTSLKYLLSSEETPVERDSVLWNYFGASTNEVLQNRSIEFIDTLPLCGDRVIDIPDVEVLKPQKRLICCKADSGTSAKIYLDSFNKSRVVKVSRNSNSDLLQNEARILFELSDCPHIIKSFGLTENGLELEQLTPWVELLNSHYYNPTESDLMDILHQLVEGLIECRNKGIAYSDIHYNNVFVTKDGTYKWGDFGIAFPYQYDGALSIEMVGENGKAKGSEWFMASETYHQNVFTESSAVYSVAMMAYFVINGMRPPFWTDSEHKDEALLRRLNGEKIPVPVFVKRFPNLWNSICSLFLKETLHSHTTFENFIELLESVKTIKCPTCNAVLKIKLSNLKQVRIIKIKCPKCSSIITIGKPKESSANNVGSCDDPRCNRPDYKSVKVSKATAPINERWGDGGLHDTDTFGCTAAFPGKTVNMQRYDSSSASINNINSASNQDVDCCPPSFPTPIPQQPTSPNRTSKRETYGAEDAKPTEKRSMWSRLFGKKDKTELVNASAYAPAEITPYKHFIVRIFIHRPEESSDIDKSVKDVDRTAVKKANKQLDVPVKEGDKVTIALSMAEGVNIDEPVQNFVWRGRYIECDFGCELTCNLYSVLGKAIVAINNVPRGDLKFTIDVVSNGAQKVYAPVETRRYSKIFISYAHADYSQVKGIAEGCKMNGSDYFFDRHTLQAGDIFKDKILKYIDNADLFVLCWSKNASESEWVQIERKHALKLIESGNHRLAIYPLSMPPEAPLPADMSDKYNFAKL